MKFELDHALVLTQRGAFTRRQALAAVHESTLRRAIRTGQVVGITPGVFAMTPTPTDSMTLFRQAELAVGRRLIACGPTAAAWHGLVGTADDGRIHVTTPIGTSIHVPAGVVAHQMVPRSPLVEVQGALATGPAHTAIDLACAAPPIDRLAILDSATRSGVQEELLLAELEMAKGRRGVRSVRLLLPHATPLAESCMESRVRQRIVESGLPAPEVQVEVLTSSGLRRLDLAYRLARIGLEYDGEEFHTGDGSLRRDRARHNALVAAGWTMVYLTASDVYRHPEQFLGLLHRLLLGHPHPLAPN